MLVPKFTLSLLYILLATYIIPNPSVNAQSIVSYACTYIERYENCPETEETVCSIYPGVCVSGSCQASDFYNRCYACQDPTVMSYTLGACTSTSPGSDGGSSGNPEEQTSELLNSGGSEILAHGEDVSAYIGEGEVDVPQPSELPEDTTNSTDIPVDTSAPTTEVEENTIPVEVPADTSGSVEVPVDTSIPVETPVEAPIAVDTTTGITPVGVVLDGSTTVKQETETDTTITTPVIPLRTSFYVVVYCDVERPTVCTNDNNPVCAISCRGGVCQKTYNNICLACADSNVLSYSLEACEIENISCPTIDFSTDTTTCTSFYDPVCAYPSGCTDKSCATTVTNSCGACYTSRANYFTLGPC